MALESWKRRFALRPERVERRVIKVPGSGLAPEDLSQMTSLCRAHITPLLGKIGTRPGPDDVELDVEVRVRVRRR